MVLTILLVIVCGAPIFYVIGVPFQISSASQQLYNAVESLPEGSAVMYAMDMNAGNFPEVEPMVVAIFEQLMSRPVRVVAESVEEDGPVLFQRILSLAHVSATPEYGYGKTWVYLGFVPGKYDVAQALLAKDLWAQKDDAYGTPLADLSVMENLHSAKDISLLIHMSQNELIGEAWIRQWVAPYGTPMYEASTATNAVALTPFVPSQIKAVLPGLKGGADYERLINKPGTAIRQLDSISLTTFYIILAVLVSNVLYHGRRMTHKGD
jgi:hypothetical protein